MTSTSGGFIVIHFLFTYYSNKFITLNSVLYETCVTSRLTCSTVTSIKKVGEICRIYTHSNFHIPMHTPTISTFIVPHFMF